MDPRVGVIFLLITSIICTHIPLRADWVSPENESFRTTRVLPKSIHYPIHTHGRSEPEPPQCTCPSIFQENEYSSSFPEEIITALEYAQCLWSCILDLPPNSLLLEANLVDADEGILAYAGPYFTRDGYDIIPCALGNCTSSMQINIDPTSVSYYYGLDANPPANQYDFVTVVLHELGHGFGFSGFLSDEDGGYRLTAPFLYPLDKRITFQQNFLWTSNPPSGDAEAAIFSDDLFFSGDAFQDGKLYAPSTFSSSSIYHWDENTYLAGTENSLMTPKLRNGEAIHSIGPLTCDLMESIGYKIKSCN